MSNTQPTRVNVNGTQLTASYRSQADATGFASELGHAADLATLGQSGNLWVVSLPITPGYKAEHYLKPMALTDAVRAHVEPLVQHAVALANAAQIGLNAADARHHTAGAYVIANVASTGGQAISRV